MDKFLTQIEKRNVRYGSYNTRLLIAFFCLFILIQDLLVENLRGLENSTVIMNIKNVDEVIILMVFLLMVISRRNLISMPLTYPLIGLVMVGFLSSLLNEVPFFIAISQLYLLIKGFLVFLIFVNLKMSEKTIRFLFRVLCFFAIIAMCFGFIDLIIPKYFREIIGNRIHIDWRGGIPSVKSIFVYPATFAWFMAFTSLFAFAFFLISKKIKYLFLSSFLFLGVFLSMRIKSITGLFIALLFGIFYFKGFQRPKYLFLFVIIFLTILISNWYKVEELYNCRLKQELKVFNDVEKKDLTPRAVLYRTSFIVAMDHFPFGAGLGRYGSWMSRVHYSPLYEQYGISEVYGLSEDYGMFLNDTFWPMIIGETGFMGLFFYLWAIGYIFLTSFKSFKYANTIRNKAFCLGVIMVFLESLVESISTPFFVKPPQAYFVFAAAGLSYSLFKQCKPKLPQK